MGWALAIAPAIEQDRFGVAMLRWVCAAMACAPDSNRVAWKFEAQYL